MAAGAKAESIVGFPRPNAYSKETRVSHLGLHKEIARVYAVRNPYFEHTDKGTPLYTDKLIEDGLRMRVGLIGAFTAEEMAATLTEQVSMYVLKDTMGKDYPAKDMETNRRLFAEMMGGFDSDRLVVIFEKEVGEKSAPVAGVQAYKGWGDLTLWQSMTWSPEGFRSSLGPFQALKATSSGMRALHGTGLPGVLANAHENEVVAMSRLFTRRGSELWDLGVQSRDLAWMAMASLIVGIHMFSSDFQLTPPKFFVYDTHRAVQGELEKIFGMEVILENGQIERREEIIGTVLDYHYISMLEDLIIGAVTNGDYLNHAMQYLIDRGVNVELHASELP